MTFGAETWNIKESQEKKMDMAEIKMLRWVYSHTLLDKIEKRTIRERVKVTEVQTKIQEKRLEWYPHVL